jgi:protein TonB
MPRTVDIYTERDDLRRWLIWSASLHVALFGGSLLYGSLLARGTGSMWGSGGDSGGEAISARLVSSVPLPASPVPTESVLAIESKGLSQSLPKPELKEPEAIPIPAKDARTKPRQQTTASRQPPPQPVEEPEDNVVPFGEGGPVSGPYAVFSAGAAKGGFDFSGGGGDFGSRFSWYVDVVRRKVSENWLKYEVDPDITSARRAYLTFDITRSGRPENIQLSQSSGVPSLDQSAIRALKRIDSFPPLPPEYSGSRVSVEFWFDYKR